MPGVVFPPPLDIGSSSGSLRLSTLASNLSMPMFAPPGVDQSNVRDEVFNELLGTYTCIVENEYGTDQAVTTISECDGADPDTTEPADSGTTEAPTCPEVTGSIYFELEGVRYDDGSTVLITDIGASTSESGTLNPDSSLVCVTSEVNTKCCRDRDGGSVGEWLFPDLSTVPRNRNSRGGDFSRSAYTEQVRLNRRNDALGPSGSYWCSVPREDKCGGEKIAASITLALPTPREVMSFCIISVWSPPPAPFDIYTGYDVRYSMPEGGEMMFSKSVTEFYQLITEDVLSMGPQEQIVVQVRVRTDSNEGPWTDPVPICDS